MANPVHPVPAAMQQQVNYEMAGISLNARIPSFWTDMPRMWFAQFEAIIGPQHQGENVKYDLVLAKLGKEELSQVADLIDDPPEQQRYTTLKKRLLKVFQESAEAQFHRLVKEMDLGQQRPSQLLAKMRELAKNTATAGDTLKNLWMSRLPGWVRAILASCNSETKLDELAGMADKIMDNLRSGEISEVQCPPPPATSLNTELLTEIRDMSAELKALRVEVNEIKRRDDRRSYRPWSRDRSVSRSRSQSRDRRRTPQSADWLCRYHFRFREAARSCEQPCNWNGNSSKGN